mmetsp:Transcript_50506/g.97595  ORF Transcript_50506/g.97595 Transcript_50506/m.97595 type:complete len:257 (+) Transcript_50506:43-813(+)
MASMQHARMPVAAPSKRMPPPPPCHAPPVMAPQTRGGDDGPGPPPATLQDVLDAVSQHVAPMLASAAQASESQVSTEIKRLEAGMTALHVKIGRVEAALWRFDQGQRGQADNLSKILQETEQRWEQDIKLIKRELHQTILAHNHSADLMADQKSVIDRIRAEIDDQGMPLRLANEALLHQQFERLLRTLEEGQMQEHEVDVLLRRGEILLQRCAALGFPALVAPSLAHGAHAPFNQSMLYYGHSAGYQPGFPNMVV